MKRDKPFLLHLDEIPDAGSDVSVVLEVDWLEPVLGKVWRSAGKGARVSYVATRDGDNLVVEGSIEADLLFECSRCGTETAQTVTEKVRSIFLPAERHRHHLEGLKVDDDSLDEFMSYEGRSFSVEQPFVDALALGLPPYPICAPECEGMEFTGGFGTSDDDATGEEVDPRWGRLLELRQKIREANRANANGASHGSPQKENE